MTVGLYPGFETFDLDVPPADGANGVRIHGVRGGQGPPVLLLHGFPQNHVMWHRIARQLARDHTVVATDLRGYGESGRPPAGDDHGAYSFRAMASDQVAVMQSLGFERFALVGHDRGARVAHRLALDHPQALERLALLDILPTSHVYGHVDRALATAYYHWFFLIQPYDLPERLIAGDPLAYLHRILGGWGSSLDAYPAEALAHYERCFADPEVRHAMIEDYRAAASIDLEHDRESDAAGRRIGVSVLVLWGALGVVGASPIDPVTVWQSRAEDPGLVSGQAIAGAGHFLVEEREAEVLSALRAFLG
jgi:haloacetate dehalogenase